MEKEQSKSVEGRGLNWKTYALLTVVGIVLVLGVVQAFQISALQQQFGGNGTASLSSGGGDAYAQMMAEMHPGQASSSNTGTTSNTAQQVGGC
ncbi:MAG: hypothetical protein V1847_03810 [Candidatus Diapherotrites archaeon]